MKDQSVFDTARAHIKRLPLLYKGRHWVLIGLIAACAAFALIGWLDSVYPARYRSTATVRYLSLYALAERHASGAMLAQRSGRTTSFDSAAIGPDFIERLRSHRLHSSFLDGPGFEIVDIRQWCAAVELPENCQKADVAARIGTHVLSVFFDNRDGYPRLSVSWPDPYVAQQVLAAFINHARRVIRSDATQQVLEHLNVIEASIAATTDQGLQKSLIGAASAERIRAIAIEMNAQAPIDVLDPPSRPGSSFGNAANIAGVSVFCVLLLLAMIYVLTWESPATTVNSVALSDAVSTNRFAMQVVFVVTGLLVPLYLLNVTVVTSLSHALMPSLAVTLVAAVGFASAAASILPKPITVTFWFYVLVFLGYAPLVQIGAAEFPWPRPYLGVSNYAVPLIVIAGSLSFVVGTRIQDITFKGSARKKLSVSEVRVRQRKYQLTQRSDDPWKALLVLSIVMYSSLPLLFNAIGGFAGLFLTREDLFGSIETQSSNTIAIFLLQMLRTPVFIFSSIGIYLVRQPGKSRPWYALPLVLSLIVATFVINNPISTPRYLVGTILITYVLLLTRWRANTSLRYSTVFLAAFLLVFPVADAFRRSTEADLSNLRLDFSSNFLSLNFDSYLMVENAVAHYMDVGADFGLNFLGAFLFFVPRFFWQGKPEPTGVRLADYQGYDFGNLSAPLWAEFYFAGGLASVVVGFMLYGFVVRWLERLSHQELFHDKSGFVTVVVSMYCGFQIILLRGSLGAVIAYLSLMVLVLILYAMLVKIYSINRGFIAEDKTPPPSVT